MNQNLPELNTPLLEAISAKIAGEPEKFDMHSWGAEDLPRTCGTTHCIAGWAVVLAGGRVVFSVDGTDIEALFPDGQRQAIAVAARDLLGLTSDEGELFYRYSLDVDGARRAIKELIEARQSGDLR